MPNRDSLDTHAGAAVYSPLVLKLYDAWVLGFSNQWAWRCNTRRVLLPFYRQHLGRRHLDVGVGTGFYPAHVAPEAMRALTLLDLNANTLHAAARRLGRNDNDMVLVEADVMAPVLALAGRRFDSIALFYLLHCMPGDMSQKERVFAHLKSCLEVGGVLYGATILGDAAEHNWLGRKLMGVYNRKGIFGNRHDTEAALVDALKRHFDDVRVRRVGKVALFEARAAMSAVEG